MSANGKRNNSGRPIEVQGAERTAIVLGVRERRILAAASQAMLGSASQANRSRVIRQMIHTSWEQARDEMKEAWRKDLIIADLQAKLQQETEARKRAEAEAARSRGRPRGREGILDRLLGHKATILAKASSQSHAPSGNPLLDQIWHNSGQDWGRVQHRLELAQEQGQWPPKEQA